MSLELGVNKVNKNGRISSHKDLVVWQKAMQLVSLVYRLTQKFPTEERFGLVSQMRRAAVSIPSNIAEGKVRSTRKDFMQFLHISRGSLAELETQLDIAADLRLLAKTDYARAMALAEEVRRMLIALIRALGTPSSKLRTPIFLHHA